MDYKNAPQCYFVRTFAVLFVLTWSDLSIPFHTTQFDAFHLLLSSATPFSFLLLIQFLLLFFNSHNTAVPVLNYAIRNGGTDPNVFNHVTRCRLTIPVAVRCNASVWSPIRLIAVIAGSNPAACVDVCLLCLLCGVLAAASATGW